MQQTNGDIALHEALSRLHQKFETFDFERAQAWALLHTVEHGWEGEETWQATAAVTSRPPF